MTYRHHSARERLLPGFEPNIYDLRRMARAHEKRLRKHW